MKLKGKTAIITGASQGIGAAIARTLSFGGARTILLARSKDLLADLVDDIVKNGGDSCYYVVDLSDGDQTSNTLQKVKQEHGIPDIIINNAGVGRFIRIEETSFTEANNMIALPYLAAFYVTRFFIEDIIKRNSGNITFINSPACIQPWASAVGYSAARWALRGFSEALTADLYGTKIVVTHVIAGKTTSNYWVNNPNSEEILPALENLFPELSPEKVAGVVVRAISKNRKRVTFPFMLKLVKWMYNLFPGLIRWSVFLTGVKRSDTRPTQGQ
jgi:short-subunit dehydrogenase